MFGSMGTQRIQKRETEAGYEVDWIWKLDWQQLIHGQK